MHHRTTSRLAKALTLLALALVTTPSAAQAATYTVDACQRPDGSYVAPDGWTPTFGGAFTGYGNECAHGGSLNAAWDASVPHTNGDHAYWRFPAPSGTTLQWVVGSRSLVTGTDQAFGSPVAQMETDKGRVEGCAVAWGCTARSGTLSAPLGSASWLRFGVECSGVNGCPAGGETRYSLKQIELTLSDESSPTISGVAGTLMSEATRVRNRALSYQASDVGGGLYWHRLLVDGQQAAAGAVDANSGRCAKVARSFSHAVPCKLSASGAIALDTATLADGAHDLKLEVFDATGENRATHGPWQIVADTRPPVIGDITVTGTPTAGEVLRGSASVDGQNATIAYQWLRAAADGSDPKPIAGATASTYHLTYGDVGHKIMLEVTATDAGGTVKRTTRATDPPFDGKVVAPCVNEEACKAAPGNNATAAAAGPGTVAIPNPDRTPGPNGTPPDAQAIITARLQRGSRTTARLVSPFGARVRVKGKITTAAGAPIRGAHIHLVERKPGAPENTWKVTGHATSSDDGSISVSSRKGGRTRELRLAYFPQGGSDENRASNTLTVIVRQDALLRVSRRNLRNGQTLRFRGAVRGQIARAGALVQLQVKLRTGWFTFKRLTVKPRSKGRFVARYTFRRTTTRTRYRFRVRVRPPHATSYATGYSVTRSVVVRP